MSDQLSAAGIPFTQERNTSSTDEGGQGAFLKSIDETFQTFPITALISLNCRERCCLVFCSKNAKECLKMYR